MQRAFAVTQDRDGLPTQTHLGAGGRGRLYSPRRLARRPGTIRYPCAWKLLAAGLLLLLHQLPFHLGPEIQVADQGEQVKAERQHKEAEEHTAVVALPPAIATAGKIFIAVQQFPFETFRCHL